MAQQRTLKTDLTRLKVWASSDDVAPILGGLLAGGLIFPFMSILILAFSR